MSDDWDVAGQVRTAFAEMVEPLSDEQWASPTLCDGWTPHEVLGHLVWPVDTASFMDAMQACEFNYLAAVDFAVPLMTQRPIPDLIEMLRSNATTKLPVDGAPEAGMIFDAAIHTQDVRRPLGLAGELAPEVVRASLDFVVGHPNARVVMDPTVVTGLSLGAPDLDWDHGTGPEVSGPGEALLLALAGRPTMGELTGEGVEDLSNRLKR